MLIARCVGVVMAAPGVPMLIFGDRLGVAVGTTFVIVGRLYAMALACRLTAIAHQRARPMLAAPWRYEISEAGIRVTTPIASSELGWANLPAVVDYPDFWLVHAPPDRSYGC